MTVMEMKPLTDFNEAQREFLTCKPSRLIRLGLEDIEKCEKQTDKFRIEMGVWVEMKLREIEGKRKQVCYVCLAGSCLVQRFEVYDFYGDTSDLTETVIDGHADNVKRRMCALNNFRCGDVIDALVDLKILSFTDDYHPIVAPEIERIDNMFSSYKYHPIVTPEIERIDNMFSSYKDDEEGYRGVTPYETPEENPSANRKFKQDMNDIADELEKIGL